MSCHMENMEMFPYWMDNIDIIMNRKDSIKNELSYGKYGNVSVLGIKILKTYD